MPDPELSGEDSGVAFEQILEQALDSGRVREALARCGRTPDRERLRREVLQARTAIVEAAAVEYRDYLEAGDGQDGCRNTVSPAVAGTRGGGWLMAVLGVVAVAAAVLLVLGFGLRAFVGRPYVGDGLMTAGLITGAVAAGAAVGDFAWSFRAAARDRSGAYDGASRDGGAEVGWVREEWELALLEWGLVPFLLDRIEEPGLVERDNRPPR
ncbi:hypothetical protein [Streptomyces sp. NBC_00989]|uniref:hypothetical protein n=1 Tax=Streptomyces sp. NBC_00989 TaxID=2903705 RepID=UPI0038656774|nr:hypothetical protein OG714_43540 [Streptomyces sp. NBC_00989]